MKTKRPEAVAQGAEDFVDQQAQSESTRGAPTGQHFSSKAEKLAHPLSGGLGAQRASARFCAWCAIPIPSEPSRSLCNSCRAWGEAGAAICHAARLLRGGKVRP